MNPSPLLVRLRRAAVLANKRVLLTLRSGNAATVVDLPVQYGGFTPLHGHTHCLVVTCRKDGTPVAQPVWPGYDGDRTYIWTEIQAYKAKRLRNNPEALIAPCSFRGKPLGPPIAARGRILETEAERRHAEQVIRSQWGWKRKAFERASRHLTDVHYIELVPATSADVRAVETKAPQHSAVGRSEQSRQPHRNLGLGSVAGPLLICERKGTVPPINHGQLTWGNGQEPVIYE